MSVERKEYQETQIYRSVSPVRTTRRSTQNLAEFDNNLDNLLEDLQSSVSRPGSSLGNTQYRESSRIISNGGTNSLNRITNLKPSNPVTEYSSDDAYTYSSPDGTKSVKTVKKEYSYSSSGEHIKPEKLRAQNNINQLDSLLDDLQQVKSSTLERESYNNFGSDPGYQDKVSSNKRTVQRELHYGDAPRSSSRSRTIERYEREGSSSRDAHYSSSEGTYGDLKSVRHTTPSPTRSNTSTLSKQTKVTNVHSYPVEVIETTAPEIHPEILSQLDPNLLPTGNTKVTTTIKTYTYEIPGSGTTTATDTEKYVYAPNQSQTTPSRSFVYNKAESRDQSLGYRDEARYNKEEKFYSESNFVDHPPYQKPAPPGGQTVVKETVTTRNYQPGYSPELQRKNKPTYVYNETTTTKNYNQNRDGYPSHPPNQHTLVTKETQTINRNGDYAPPNHHTTVIHQYDSNTTNKDSPGWRYPNREVEVFDPKRPPYAGSPPQKNLNISYQYQSSKSSSNNYRGGPPESEPLLHPRPFPTNETDGPPKRVEELMANIGQEPPNSPYNAAFNAHEAERQQQKKVETLIQQHEAEIQKHEPKHIQSTKNVSGPPVYYPPGHEMFAKKEESGAWRAEGAMAKERGKYKYEAEEKSKSKGGSGAAIVPVCLPLCCGLPCTIL